MITHGMGGFSVEKAREVFNFNERYEIIAVIAAGYYGDKDQLSEYNKERERPGTRKEIEELLL